VSIPKRLAHRFAKLARFGAFQQRQRVPGRLPSPAPQPDLLAFEPRFAGNLFIQASLKSQQNDLRPLRNHPRFAPRTTQLFQDHLLTLRNPNLRRLPWHMRISLVRIHEMHSVINFPISWETNSKLLD
jgi:hypothetical protein